MNTHPCLVELWIVGLLRLPVDDELIRIAARYLDGAAFVN